MTHNAPFPTIAPPKTSILDTIGNTPLVRINRLAPDHVELFVKLEAFNPGGSIKDRFALAAIEAAEASGALKPGQTVVEATSGNTGIGLALVCAAKGYPLVVTMAESFSVERRKLMRFLGARVVLTPAAQKGTGMLAKAEELAREHGWFLARQFENEANADMHSRTTAREIIDAFGGTGPDIWVTGFGTGGTLKGVSRVLRAECPATRIVVAEPDNVPMLQSGIPQERDAEGRPASHPSFRPHLMQGWSPDFIAKLAEDAVAAGSIDAYQPVSGNAALQAARDLAAQEGIFCGISGGATFAAALEAAKSAPAGTKIVAMLPDTGERYMSTVLFDEVAEEMSPEEEEIARSTPGYRFDVATPAPAAAPLAPPSCTPEAARMVDEIVAQNPVVMFVLEWCEFSWSVRKLFASAGIPYHAVELDAAAMQTDNLGGELRAALGVRAGVPTIPQIFVGGEHVGGATDTFDGFRDGSMNARLAALGIAFDASKTANPYGFLPAWMHPR
ncbi:O-acetylserine lyase [Pseudothioclava arenosa]|uniref:Cysteine synthase B n=2 Tax=Pseudothioclava arenosa TaxID=1795308 RepID=A0A2A4CTG7_9RHOB|nr:O-acetylserine lyase [Pseudothioclava arenosa]